MEQNSTDLCYVISHGFAARMLLQTGLIRRLAEQGKTIAIITPDAEDANLKELAVHENISLYNSEINLTIWDDDYGFKRVYYLEDLRSNPVFWEKHLYSIYYSKSKHPWKRVRPFYYYTIFRLIKYFPSIRERFKKTESKHIVSKKALELLKRINPKLVISTYPINFLETKITYAAQQLNIATMTHLLSWDNITSKGIFPVIADHFIVWGNVMYKELKEYYKLEDHQVQVCGVPHFDHHIEVKKNPQHGALLEKLGLKNTAPYIFVAMSSPRFAPKEIDIVEWLAKQIDKGVFGPHLQLVVRPHPQNVQGSLADRSWIKRLDGLQSDRVSVDYPRLVKSKVRWSMQKDDMNHLSNLLAGCSVCINSGSTVSIDALMLDKPVILTSFDGQKDLTYWKSARRLIDYPHQKKFVELGGAKVVHSLAAFQQAIQQYLDNPQLDAEKRQYALQEECFQNDGKATERVVAAVDKVLQEIKGVKTVS